MATNLTVEASAGWYWQHTDGSDPESACPYLYSSPKAMGWHLGRHLERWGFARPGVQPGDMRVFMSRGDRLRLDAAEKKSDRATFFRWNSDNTFNEEA